MERSTVSRYGLALFWIVAGVMHFVIPRRYEATMPPHLRRWKRELVAASGVAELAGGLAVLPHSSRRGARWWLLATLAAIYPANVQMALHPEEYEGIPSSLLWARLAVQGLFALHIWRGTR